MAGLPIDTTQVMFKSVAHGMALCAGAGGLELGLRIALGDDYRCVVYVEREAYAAATLVARMEDQALDTAPVWDDVATFDGRPWRGVVDLVSAGFSCQPWSVAGRQLGIEDERWIWPDIARVIREVGPEWVFLENVPELVGGGLEHVLSTLAAERFHVEWDCVSAAEVGATHERQRLYILGHAASYGWGEGWPEHELRGRRNTSTHSDSPVADTTRLQWEAQQWIGTDGDVGSFPPRPDDLLAWESVPEILEPALCRVAHGVAHRVDRLRLTGNGVVPLVAAVAFLRLRDRLMAA